MTFIDTHCHLDVLDNLELKLNQAKTNSVEAFIAPATHVQSAKNLLTIAKTYPNVFIAVGIQPVDVKTETHWKTYPQKEVETIEYILSTEKNNRKIVAIGECGLDFKNTNDSNKKIQIQLFKQHLEWAEEFHLPLVIHNRNAGIELTTLLTNRDLSGVFHCFSGSKKLVRKILDLNNFYFGIGGLITLDTGLMQVVKQIPLTRIVLETDSPYLTPKPIREQISWLNQPGNIIYVAKKLAQIKKISFDEIARIATENTKRLFSIIPPSSSYDLF